MEIISNFELYGNEGFSKSKRFRCFEKINIFLFLALVAEIIYLICILYFLGNQKGIFLELNYRKYQLNNDNEELNHELNENIEKNHLYNSEIKDKKEKMKIFDDYIRNYTQLTKELINGNLTNNEIYIKLKEKNNEKIKKINELRLIKENSKINFKQIIDSIIIDKEVELNNIINLIDNLNPNEIKNRIKLCYRGENFNLNLTEAFEKCDLKNNIPYLILFQTDIFKRYGAFISANSDKNSLNFAILPNGFISKTKIQELDLNRKKSLIYIINLIKEYKFDNSENSLESRSKIFDLEIFHI